MAPITMGLGIFLTLLGIGGYLGTDRVSVTALIPTFFGVPLLLLGLLARNDSMRKHAMHAAVMIGLLGFLGTAGMVASKLPTVLSGGTLERPIAAYMQVAMAIACGIFVVLCVRSFIEARRSRECSGSVKTSAKA